jgi:hypothetical protein
MGKSKFAKSIETRKTLKKRRSLITQYFPESNEHNQLTRTFSTCSMKDENFSQVAQNSNQPHSNPSLILSSSEKLNVTTASNFFNPVFEPFEHPILDKK